MGMNNILLGIGSWLKATRNLSDRAKGCYIDLLCEYYRTGGPLPYDEQSLTTAAGYKNVRSLRITLAELIKAKAFTVVQTPDGPVLVNEKADREIAAYEAKRSGNARGGANGKPHSKTPRPDPVSEDGFDVSAANGGDMGAVSPPYHAHFDGKSEENQHLSAKSSSTLNLYNTTAQAHARGPTLVTVPPAPDASAREAKAARMLARLRGQDTAPPAEGTPEYVEWELRQRITRIRLEIQKLCGDLLSPTAVLHTGIIEAWIAEGADVDQHIYPAVRHMVDYAERAGKTIGGINYFTKKVEELRDAGKAKPGAKSSSAKRHSGSGYGQNSAPVSPEMKAIMETVSLARQNGWDQLLGAMAPLLTPASQGDEQSLLKLKELHANHRERVRVPHSKWVAQHSSAA